VLFVRSGPYSPAILRFQVSFPDMYPARPPLVTFATDIFHPLITPLTTYMYSTDVSDAAAGGTVSATDEERLPPGGFSLRHGFGGWFGRGGRGQSGKVGGGSGSAGGSGSVGGSASGGEGVVVAMTPTRAVATATGTTPGSGTSVAESTASVPGYARTGTREVSTYEVLRYIRSAFDDEDVLDSVPLEAAGNPGAWHAWRTHRRQAAVGKDAPGQGPGVGVGAEGEARPEANPAPGATARRPEEWNWEGVWEERVKRGIAASLSDGVLFGNAGSTDEVVRRWAPCCVHVGC
jgi:hypothetical protein